MRSIQPRHHPLCIDRILGAGRSPVYPKTLNKTVDRNRPSVSCRSFQVVQALSCWLSVSVGRSVTLSVRHGMNPDFMGAAVHPDVSVDRGTGNAAGAVHGVVSADALPSDLEPPQDSSGDFMECRTNQRRRPAFCGSVKLDWFTHLGVLLGLVCQRIGWPQRSPQRISAASCSR